MRRSAPPGRIRGGLGEKVPTGCPYRPGRPIPVSTRYGRPRQRRASRLSGRGNPLSRLGAGGRFRGETSAGRRRRIDSSGGLRPRILSGSGVSRRSPGTRFSILYIPSPRAVRVGPGGPDPGRPSSCVSPLCRSRISRHASPSPSFLCFDVLSIRACRPRDIVFDVFECSHFVSSVPAGLVDESFYNFHTS